MDKIFDEFVGLTDDITHTIALGPTQKFWPVPLAAFRIFQKCADFNQSKRSDKVFKR